MRRSVKRVALGLFRTNLATDRFLRRVRGRPSYGLGGECRGCARCCEEPSIRANALVWHLGSLRSAFLWWQTRVNGFVLVGTEPRERLFVFRCTHFDALTRRCDSYETRPGICRDYPRGLLQQPRPEFLPGCGYRAVDPRGKRLLRVLEEHDVPSEQIEKLKAGLYLE